VIDRYRIRRRCFAVHRRRLKRNLDLGNAGARDSRRSVYFYKRCRTSVEGKHIALKTKSTNTIFSIAFMILQKTGEPRVGLAFELNGIFSSQFPCIGARLPSYWLANTHKLAFITGTFAQTTGNRFCGIDTDRCAAPSRKNCPWTWMHLGAVPAGMANRLHWIEYRRRT